MGAAGPRRRSHLSLPSITADNLPTWLFGALVAVAGPLLLFHYGSYHWFLGDDWAFVADRHRSLGASMMDPHGGSHWVAVPRLAYEALWQLFGITTYRPYQVLVVTMHLAVAVLLRLVMRRAGVRPWLAAAAAGVFVLCGPGAVNTVWAFQVGFNGSLAFGLAQLLVADHDGPIGRRDAIALVLGLLAITSSGIGISTTVAVAVAILLRRGWKAAAVQTAPLAVVYGLWVVLTDASTSGPFGTPPLDVLTDWVSSAAIGTFQGLGHFEGLAWVFLGLLVAGGVVAFGTVRERGARSVAKEIALPLGLCVGAVFFAWTTGLGRAWLGPENARAPRYVYLGAALLLPLLAVCAELVARAGGVRPCSRSGSSRCSCCRSPSTSSSFDQGAYGEAYMERRERIMTTAVRMPFAGDVPGDVQPEPDPFSTDLVTMSFLLRALEDGRLTPSSSALSDEVLNEFKVRLGVAQREESTPLVGCRSYDRALIIEPEVGDRLHLGSDVLVATIEDGQRTTRPVARRPSLGGTELTVELADLQLWIGPARGASTFRLCEVP